MCIDQFIVVSPAPQAPEGDFLGLYLLHLGIEIVRRSPFPST
jgi:hypothetical protein